MKANKDKDKDKEDCTGSKNNEPVQKQTVPNDKLDYNIYKHSYRKRGSRILVKLVLLIHFCKGCFKYMIFLLSTLNLAFYLVEWGVYSKNTVS